MVCLGSAKSACLGRIVRSIALNCRPYTRPLRIDCRHPSCLQMLQHQPELRGRCKRRCILGPFRKQKRGVTPRLVRADGLTAPIKHRRAHCGRTNSLRAPPRQSWRTRSLEAMPPRRAAGQEWVARHQHAATKWQRQHHTIPTSQNASARNLRRVGKYRHAGRRNNLRDARCRNAPGPEDHRA